MTIQTTDDMTPPPNPIAALSSAIDGVKSHLKSLDEREEEIRRERKAVTDSVVASGLTGLLPCEPGPPPQRAVSAPVPMLALNQDGLPHQIVAALRATPALAVSEVAAAVKSAPKDVSAALKKMVASGIVASKGKARGMRYSLAKAGAK